MSLAHARILRRRLARDLANRTAYSFDVCHAALYDLEGCGLEGDPLVFFLRCELNGLSPTRVAAHARLEAEQRLAVARQEEELAARKRRIRLITLGFHGFWAVLFGALTAGAVFRVAQGELFALLGLVLCTWLGRDHVGKFRRAW